ncbi:uncharacterized protein RJT21DRAFT_90557 [Scheffersomyces amazonensis]|uniref:uncharacterized protein n=1 Tax=Scheffersomyces amazonensis TaxID=1078765 RepID=UPI00315D0869
MGVNSLWDILGPTARPVRLDALSRKRLAVDASIWIYQFLKAVRDQEGNSLPQSHIVGFFRRICKLLYFGIRPVFVFDGGAPALKRETINKRRERRRGNAETTRQTAQKLLAIQLQRAAEQSYKPNNNKVTNIQTGYDIDDEDEDIIYLEDLPINHPQQVSSLATKDKDNNINVTDSPERPKSFRKTDEYHLPEIKEFRVSKDDGRIMAEEDYMESKLESYDYDHVDGIDINEIDPSSKEFEQLPLETQYMILSHLRVKSRLRLGFNKKQLEDIFTDSMDFSKFQIRQVQRRNFYTQKLMNVAGMGDDGNASKRIASNKDRRYALVKNENGWTMSLQEPESTAENPIYLDEKGNEFKYMHDVKKEVNIVSKKPQEESKNIETIESDSDFEDVPLESKIKEEEEEEKNIEDKELQLALVRSIYDQYENDEHNIITDNGFNENEIKLAIENSKKDYLELQNKEKELNFDIITAKITSQDLPANNNNISNDDLKLPEKFNLGESIFAGSPEKTPLKTIINDSDDKNDKITFGPSIFVENLDGKEVIGKEAIEENTVDIEPKIPEIVYSEDEFDEIENKHIDKVIIEDSTEDTRVKEMPTWFTNGNSSVLNAHKEPFIPKSTINQVRKEDDNETGLISWSEAKDIIQQRESDNEHDSDVEEIIAPIPKEPAPNGIDHINEEESRKAEILDYDFEEEDEVELLEQMRTEENDHEDFRTKIKQSQTMPVKTIGTTVTDEQLLQEKYQKAKRDSDEVSEAMITDVQELLRRFGIPYITAPMEAEAQCAELLKIGLVDGIITDDSDCFLFGGDKIYKNMFNQKQYVECYLKDDLEGKLGLSQDNLIEFALLLGSDYTEGIKGIGPVMAMEILAEFGSLKKFKDWYDIKTTTVQTPDQTLSTLEKSLVSRIKNGKLYLPESFPDNVIFDAYKLPEVDHDRTEFKWGVPNLDQIRTYLMFNVGWNQSQVDEVMIPLIRDMNRKLTEGTQSTIGEFFPQEYIQLRKELNIGKRMKSAANKLHKRKKLSSS